MNVSQTALDVDDIGNLRRDLSEISRHCQAQNLNAGQSGGFGFRKNRDCIDYLEASGGI
jgi:hypothetical protein